jgi:hypothetical protein
MLRLLAARRGLNAAALSIEPLRWWPMAAGCVALQLCVVPAGGDALPPGVRTAVIWGSHAVLTAVALANLRVRWLGVVAAGLVLNLLVMGVNGGLMPVSPETLVRGGRGQVLERVAVGQPLPRSKDVILPVEQTRLAFLSDTLVVPWRRGSFSVGDVFIAVGVFLVLQGSVRTGPAGETRAAGPARTSQAAQAAPVRPLAVHTTAWRQP